MLVEEIRVTIGPGGPCKTGNRIYDLREIALARGERLLRALLVVYIDDQVEPAQDLPPRVTQRDTKNVEPAIHPIEAAMPALHIVCLAGCVCGALHADHSIDVVGMNDIGSSPFFQLIESPAEILRGRSINAFDFAGWRRDGYRHGDTVDDQLEIKFPPPQLLVGLRKFPGSRIDALIEFLGKALLLPYLPCRLQADRCQVSRDIQEKTFGQAREL